MKTVINYLPDNSLVKSKLDPGSKKDKETSDKSDKIIKVKEVTKWDKIKYRFRFDQREFFLNLFLEFS